MHYYHDNTVHNIQTLVLCSENAWAKFNLFLRPESLPSGARFVGQLFSMHHWIRRYILFHDKKRPKDMGAVEIEKFLTYLAVERNIAASTQNQAFSAVLFLYKEVLKMPLDTSFQFIGAKSG